jgi:transposase
LQAFGDPVSCTMMRPAGVKVHLALGYTDMRNGMDGLAVRVQATLKRYRFKN